MEGGIIGAGTDVTVSMDLGAVDGCEAGHPVFETAGGSASVIGRLVAK